MGTYNDNYSIFFILYKFDLLTQLVLTGGYFYSCG